MYGISVTQPPSAISRQESVFWHMGIAAGLDYSILHEHLPDLSAQISVAEPSNNSAEMNTAAKP